ncbi:MAG: hypothetical protein J7539_07535 [Niabella sp.]|nr:hypothetical protein [Niabella sp.]
MKKRSILLAAVLAVATFVISWKAASDNAAVHITDFNCWLYNGAGHLVDAMGSGNAVITHSDNRNVVCKASGLANPMGSEVMFNAENKGVPCNALGVFTKDWHETVSASGEATLICHVH